jgi:transcriptional regulator with PAS, ATPase and Fis domain
MMPQKPIDVGGILAVTDPVERNRLLLEAMDAVRALQAELGAARSAAVTEVYREHGGTRAAELLGVSRTALYKAVGDATVRPHRGGGADR